MTNSKPASVLRRRRRLLPVAMGLALLGCDGVEANLITSDPIELHDGASALAPELELISPVIGFDEEAFEAILATNNQYAPDALPVLHGPYAQEGQNGVSAAVIKPGQSSADHRGHEVMWVGAVGYSHTDDAGTDVPLDPAMVLDLASVSKSITAGLIAQRYGMIIDVDGETPLEFGPGTTLDDLMPLFNTTFFAEESRKFESTPSSPNVPIDATIIENVDGGITVAQLIGHQSGLGWLEGGHQGPIQRVVWDGDPNAETGIERDLVINWGRPDGPGIDKLERFRPSLASPGQGDPVYSNEGYEVLGLILVALEVKPIDQILSETMADLDPLRGWNPISEVYADYGVIPADVPLAHGWSAIDGPRIHCVPGTEPLDILMQPLNCVETQYRHNHHGDPYTAGFPNTTTQLSDGYHLIPGDGVRQSTKWVFHDLNVGYTSTCFFYWRWWLGDPAYWVCYDQSFLGQEGMVYDGYDDLTREMERLNPRPDQHRRPYPPETMDWAELRDTTVSTSGGMYGTPGDVGRLFQELYWYDLLLGHVEQADRQHLADSTLGVASKELNHPIGCRPLVEKGGLHNITSVYVVMDVETGITAVAAHNSAPVGDFGFTINGGLETFDDHLPMHLTKRIALDLLEEALAQQGEGCEE